MEVMADEVSLATSSVMDRGHCHDDPGYHGLPHHSCQLVADTESAPQTHRAARHYFHHCLAALRGPPWR